MKFMRRPTVIEAVQVPQPDQMMEHGLVWGFFYRHHFGGFCVTDDRGYNITTLEGIMHASPGDWIVCGTAGEMYPVKAIIFDDLYIPVSEDTPCA